MERAKLLYTKYKHGLPMIAYMIVYLAWFSWLEKNNTGRLWLVHMTVDDYIPFCEVFVIPYCLWFGYVAATVIYLFFKDKGSYYKSCIFLCTGMTLFLVISTLWPNGHNLRPATLAHDNIFTMMIAALWRTDTPTNLWPSIHVFNSMGAHFAITNCPRLMEGKHGKQIKWGSAILAISIILSTMFIKQHSVFDVLTALALGSVMYVLVYRREWIIVSKTEKEKRKPQVG